MTAAALRQFEALLAASLEQHQLSRLLLANHRGDDPTLQRVIGREIMLRGRPHLSLLYRHATRDVTRNLALADGVREVLALLDPAAGARFGHAHLRTRDEEIDLRISRKGQFALGRRSLADAAAAAAAAAPRPAGAAPDPAPPDGAAVKPAHDRSKQRLLALESPWWVDLGVTDAQRRLIPAMSRKWKQINRFVEVLDAAWRESTLAPRDPAAPPLRVMDFGAGKGYLSFAVWAHLTQTIGAAAEVTGVELRADLVELCNRSASRHELHRLHFEQGDVMHHAIGTIDIMIALHACDTATDHAIHKGIAAGAAIILCSPCCHQQLRPQLRSPGLLRPMLQHGIHLGQQAEMITDSLRALLLEAHGYRTQVFEFVSLEHTSKNKMILAVRRDSPAPADPLLAQIRAIKDFYGVREHCLETLLGLAGPDPA